MSSMKKAVVTKECAACGSCIPYCPKSAISVHKGMYAIVDEKRCIGCGKCMNVCPAAVISIISKGGVEVEKTLV